MADHPRIRIDPNRFEQFGLGHLCIWVKIELNRSKSFMYELGHVFRFIDPIKIESNLSKFLELFGLVLNTVNIETPSVGIGSVETTSVGLLKVLLLGTLLFVLPFFIFIFSGMFIILMDHILFICFSNPSATNLVVANLVAAKLIVRN